MYILSCWLQGATAEGFNNYKVEQDNKHFILQLLLS